MISITAAAAAHLRGLIKHSRGQPEQAVKLVSNGKNGLSMSIGTAGEGDTVLHDDSGPVLIIAAEVAQRLDGLVFDRLVTEVDGQPNVGYSFRRPTEAEVAGPGADAPLAQA